MEFSATHWLGIARPRPSRHRTSAAEGGANVEVRPCPDEYKVMTASGLTPLGRRGHRLLLERQRSSASTVAGVGRRREQELIKRKIEPAPEFETDLGQGARVDEAELFVQGDAGPVIAI